MKKIQKPWKILSFASFLQTNGKWNVGKLELWSGDLVMGRLEGKRWRMNEFFFVKKETRREILKFQLDWSKSSFSILTNLIFQHFFLANRQRKLPVKNSIQIRWLVSLKNLKSGSLATSLVYFIQFCFFFLYAIAQKPKKGRK